MDDLKRYVVEHMGYKHEGMVVGEAKIEIDRVERMHISNTLKSMKGLEAKD